MFLLKNQKADGAIYDRGNPIAITALSLMSLAAVGHLPIHPNEKGEAMAKALDFILLKKNQNEMGYFGKDGGRMYGHGIVTLTLAEMLGMGMDQQRDKLIREKCQKAIDLIVRSQKVKKNKSKLDEQGNPINKKSGFAYQPGGHPEYATTAAGLLAMQVCGEYESPFVLGAADWLLENVPQTNRKFFFYGTYYYAQALYQRGDEHAKKARKLVEEILLPMQKQNGSWQGGGSEAGAGEVYCSSMAILALAVKYHYLPIYQR